MLFLDIAILWFTNFEIVLNQFSSLSVIRLSGPGVHLDCVLVSRRPDLLRRMIDFN